MSACRAWFRPVGLAALVLLALAAQAAAVDGPALLAKMDRNLDPENYEMTRKLINEEPDGKRKEFILYSVKKGRDKVAALFLAPASDKGRSTLRQGDNMWLYIPNVGKPVRITSLQSVTGGVFNNADILRVDYAEEYEVAAATEQADTYLLDLKARTGAVAYDRLKVTVDKKTVLPTVIEAYAASGMLVKTLRFKDVKDFGGGVRRPATVETDSPLYKGYKSVMLYAAVKKREVPDEVFTLNFMSRLEELRK
ncbi:MAG: outer membrane lipoprotein-sorting protein [Rubrivivax sp.]|nr:outer membrane lipoprotein-sorting protein [Rubrivivax sp.]